MKVVIADDDPAMLARRENVLSTVNPSYGSVDICGKISDGLELLKIVKREAPGIK